MPKKPTTTAPAWLVSLRDEADARCVGQNAVAITIRFRKIVESTHDETPPTSQPDHTHGDVLFIADQRWTIDVTTTAPLTHPLLAIALRNFRRTGLWGFTVAGILKSWAISPLQMLGVRGPYTPPEMVARYFPSHPEHENTVTQIRSIRPWLASVPDHLYMTTPPPCDFHFDIVDVHGCLIDACRARSKKQHRDETDEPDAILNLRKIAEVVAKQRFTTQEDLAAHLHMGLATVQRAFAEGRERGWKIAGGNKQPYQVTPPTHQPITPHH